mmetsp:Transcript_33674/g.99871  ORF Transcript_33674/g.99871 Transcript_33674/m.99871 type:complete len:384 (-) Transcript_33674:68-1219(-)
MAADLDRVDLRLDLAPEVRLCEARHQVDRLAAVLVRVRLLGVREVDHHIGGVHRRRARHAAAAKKVGHLRHRPAVHRLACLDQQQLVEEPERLGARLVDGAGEGAAAVREAAERRDHLLRAVRVQPRGWLVEQYQSGAREELDRDRDAAALSARQASRHVVADPRVGDVREVNVLHRRVNQLEPLVPANVGTEPQRADKPERLPDGERRVAAVLLHHVRARRPKVRPALRAVQPHVPLDDADALGVGEDVEEGRLAAARRPHDGGQRPRPQHPAHALEHVQLLPLAARQRHRVVHVAEGDEGGRRGAALRAPRRAVHPPAAAARDPAARAAAPPERAHEPGPRSDGQNDEERKADGDEAGGGGVESVDVHVLVVDGFSWHGRV